MIQTHKIPLDVKFDSVGRYGVILGNLAEMVGEPFLAIECTFALAARVRVGNETTVPPVGADIIEEVVHHAITKGCGYDFADHGVTNNKSHATTRFVIATHNTIAQSNGVLHGIEFVTVFIHGMAFAFACGVISRPKFVQKKTSEASVVITSHC